MSFSDIYVLAESEMTLTPMLLKRSEMTLTPINREVFAFQKWKIPSERCLAATRPFLHDDAVSLLTLHFGRNEHDCEDLDSLCPRHSDDWNCCCPYSERYGQSQ
jgi:hypothetical protein